MPARWSKGSSAGYRCGIAWRDVPEVFGPWRTIWTWHRRMAGDGTWDTVLQRLHAEADAAGLVDWSVSVDATIARAHRTPPTSPAPQGAGSNYKICVPSRLIMRSATGAPRCTTSSTGTAGRW
ncbi:transposase [Amycolatopsis stemonae]